MNVTRERCHDDATLRSSNNVFDNRADVFFERCESGDVGVGRVTHKQIETGLANTRKGAKVGKATIEWQLIHLEVTRVQNRSGHRLDNDG